MHLMTALELKRPTMAFKTLVLASQALFVTLFSVAYMIGPRYCHRFVGYLEEEAVVTYTKCLKADATMKDVILAIRADEAHHRLVNHTLASMERDDFNPYKPGQ
ncbi:hypothetical protein LSH36_113g05007 [Paralvinella palmiformis]|uniref:Alternative oxidase n=1 Tax=Paralvinella palmiformis TaxID=53620 RepID=A0AAD9JY84_9ANNE|nr:hypothetical protein LSH36_113g05007 [Paralvinella palmiformis]